MRDALIILACGAIAVAVSLVFMSDAHGLADAYTNATRVMDMHGLSPLHELREWACMCQIGE